MGQNRIICAKGTADVNAGNNTWSRGTPMTQTEAATELIINRLQVIDLLQRGKISSDSTIVTLPERKFLYENIFENVEVWDDQSKQTGIDLVKDIAKTARSLPYKPFYKHYERDKHLIHDIKYNDEILNTDLPKFAIVIPRLKKSDIRRNLDQAYWAEAINKARELNSYEKIFVFGKGNENLDDGEKVFYIDTLQDFCSYIHHESCHHVISTISGPCHYVQQFGNVNKQTKMTMIDHMNLIPDGGHDDPSYFHPCINFTEVQIEWIKWNPLPSPKELGKMI